MAIENGETLLLVYAVHQGYHGPSRMLARPTGLFVAGFFRICPSLETGFTAVLAAD
jgi:hypothetical protein